MALLAASLMTAALLTACTNHSSSDCDSLTPIAAIAKPRPPRTGGAHVRPRAPHAAPNPPASAPKPTKTTSKKTKTKKSKSKHTHTHTHGHGHDFDLCDD
ncbi:hypothetical protein HY68_01370 [Streptomyces sp. AcH 505]|uniref:hypothetical protein n=1 Tax=Streptomyces sp. AcH 505 TaxID=352211 RepID=UPI0005918FF4|nr:hypothetical protein HY68_01370 [Streptomyces sp. AcH 505]